MINNKKYNIDAGWLYEEYIAKNRTAKDIAKELKCPKYIVANNIKKNKLYKPHKNSIHIEKLVLVDLYQKQKLTVRQIGQKLNVSYNTVKRNLDKYDIQQYYNNVNPYASLDMSETNGRIHDLRRKRFGRLVAIKQIAKDGKSYYLCLCDCGNSKDILRQNLVRGNTTSCGCFAKEKKQRQFYKGCGELTGSYWGDIVRNAKYRNIEFCITIEEAWDLFLKQNRKCLFTGETLIFCRDRAKEKGVQTASLDRIDNNKGYNKENCQWIHKRVNKLKNDFKTDEFLLWVHKIEIYQSTPNSVT